MIIIINLILGASASVAVIIAIAYAYAARTTVRVQSARIAELEDRFNDRVDAIVYSHQPRVKGPKHV